MTVLHKRIRCVVSSMLSCVLLLICNLSHSKELVMGPDALSVTNTGGAVVFSLKLAASASGKFVITDESFNRTMRKYTLVSMGNNIIFSWDGTDERGKAALPGKYLVYGLLKSGQHTESLFKYFPYQGSWASVASLPKQASEPLIKMMNTSKQSVISGEDILVSYALSRPAKLRSFLTCDNGISIRELQLEGNSLSLPTTENHLIVSCIGSNGQPLPAGHYRLTLTAFLPGEMETRAVSFAVILNDPSLGGSSNGDVARDSSMTAGPATGSDGSVGNNAGTIGVNNGSSNNSGGLPGLTNNGKNNKGVRDHGIGQGRDDAGQGKGRGSDNGKK